MRYSLPLTKQARERRWQRNGRRLNGLRRRMQHGLWMLRFAQCNPCVSAEISIVNSGDGLGWLIKPVLRLTGKQKVEDRRKLIRYSNLETLRLAYGFDIMITRIETG